MSFLLQQRLGVDGGMHAQKEDKGGVREVIWKKA